MLKRTDNTGEYQIMMPSINSDWDGYSFLSKLQKNLTECKDLKTLRVIFPRSCFIEANLCAVLGSIFPASKVNFSFHSSILPYREVKNVLKRNGFLAYYGGDSCHSCTDTTVQYRIFRKHEVEALAIYISKDIFKVGAFPKMSAEARKNMIKYILEIFDNSISHGQTDKVFICGQYYPKKALLKFTLVDLGISIKKNIYNCKGLDLSGTEAIQWAISDNNTTRSGKTPGGLGLKLLREFLKMNGGYMQIVSNDGFWEGTKDKDNFCNIPNAFSGTIVTVSFNTNDNKQYFATNEIL